MDVAQRSKLFFVLQIIQDEEIEDLMCYSTFHIDCKPWYNNSAVIIGDAAHAYGPLTAKMANLAINDAYTLGQMLNEGTKQSKSQALILHDWEKMQLPKFETTKIRTLRHLQLYSPGLMQAAVGFLWSKFPNQMCRYFSSIFAYDYEIYGYDYRGSIPGTIGIKHADPLRDFLQHPLLFIISSVLLASATLFVMVGDRACHHTSTI